MSLRISPVLRWPIAMTLLSAIVGIAIQSIKASQLVLSNFFGANYWQWLKEVVAAITLSPSGTWESTLMAILLSWYYAFLTAGYIMIVWGIIILLVHTEVELDD